MTASCVAVCRSWPDSVQGDLKTSPLPRNFLGGAGVLQKLLEAELDRTAGLQDGGVRRLEERDAPPCDGGFSCTRQRQLELVTMGGDVEDLPYAEELFDSRLEEKDAAPSPMLSDFSKEPPP